MKYWLVVLPLFLLVYLGRLFFWPGLDLPDGAEVRVVGKITSQPYLKGSNQILIINQFWLQTDRFPAYAYGEKIEVVGKVKKRVINRFLNQYALYYPSIWPVSEKESLINQSKIRGSLFKLRQEVESRFARLLPEPQASLLAGILLGAKQDLPENFRQDLRETGTLHVVVASGYNITVVAGFLLTVLAGRLNRKLALVISLLGIAAYMLMAGAEPPVVRAAIMGGLTYLAMFLGREKDALTGLAAAAMTMLLVHPLILFDIGFQLSFLATAGILFIYPAFKGRVFRWPWLGEELRVTLSAQLGVLPLLLFHFGEVSFLSPLINALVLPVTPLIMLLGVVVSLASLVPGLAQLMAWLAWVPLTYFVGMVRLFGKLSWGMVSLSWFSWWWAIGYYLVLGIWLIRVQKSKVKSQN